MNPASMRSSCRRSTLRTSAHSIASSTRRSTVTPSSSMPRGISEWGPHTATWAPSFVRPQMLERATRECRMSPTRHTFTPSIRDKLGRIEGVKVCLVGDILHSRVARSNIWGLTKLGAQVAVCGPHSLMPRGIEELGVTVLRRVEEAIEWADVLNVLRLQLERMEAGFIPSLREYYRVFGVTVERLAKAPRALAVMHPGPMNRGVEIDSRVADGPHSVILDQVTNGVAVRMAVLYLLAGGKPELADAAKGPAVGGAGRWGGHPCPT